ncbi:MAG: O-antigen ligase family protein, partial [Lachnospiraceae bacterium]|nr:O-antigen ligase family protein [Lachnospiraceae bacterium]
GYGWLVFLFFAGIVLFRNTRTWPFSVAVPFTCLYLYRFDQVWINRLLKNFCYGCILAFWLMFGSGALFRPYYSFEFVRYPGWFSSVATAGLFWMLVFACTLCCILAKYEGRGSIRNCIFELATLGAAGTYLLLGMSRTSLLGTAVVCVAAFFLSEVVRYRDSLREMALKVVLVICPILLVFPVVYTVVRCIPAVTGRPMWITRAEWFSDRIRKDEPMDSSKYMNVPQLAESLLEKLLGIDINLSAMAGAVSGPGNGVTIDEDGNMTFDDNVVDYYIADNGQIYTTKDYTFTNEDTEDVSNGRFDIFKLYFKNLNLTGHDSMIVENAPEGIILYHAHNSYMQVAYDHGVPVGILFILVVTGGLIYSIIYYKKQYKKVNFAIFPAVVIVSFMIGGLTEWIFHPSIPIGFAFLIALTPLVSAQSQDKH